MGKKEVFSIILFCSGAFFISLSLDEFTGAFIGTSQISNNLNLFIGLILIFASLHLSSVKGRNLESILHEMDSFNVPKFQDVETGIKYTKSGELFRVGTSFYLHVPSKTEAANIAKELVGEGSETLWCYRYSEGGHYVKTRLTSTDEEVLISEHNKLRKEGLVHHEFAKKSIGFATGEQTAKSGGRTWKRYARFDEPLEYTDMPYKHYNVGGRDFKRKDVHIVIYKK